MINISIQNATEKELNRPQLRRWVNSTLRHLGTHEAQIALIFLEIEEARKINQQYRKKNYATNVLTFNLTDEAADIVVCPDVIIAEATAQKKTFHDHLGHIVVHGVLHAMGYDHVKKADATVMEALEVSILKRFSIKNPY
jgi:probable rRNA maturation factor